MRNPLRFTYLSKGRYWRFRHKLVGDVKLPHEKGLHWSKQPERAAFMEKYAALLAKVEGGAPKPVSRRSFPWLIDQYAKSAEFKALADSTQLDYSRTLNLLKVDLAAVHFETASRPMLKAERDQYADQPRKAHKIKQMLSRLYTWADENGHVEAGVNPAGGIKRIKRKGGDREIVVWSDAEIAAFLDGAPLHVTTPVLLALYTGQRREDVVTMTWQQYQGDTIRVRQSKTTAMLDIACHSKLRAHLDSIKKRGVVICTTEAGKAYTANALSQAVRRRVTSLDSIPNNRSMHGLRYAAGSKMEEAGCTIAEVSAVLGHRTHQMAMKYATQRQRSKAATAKLEASA